MEGIVKRVAEYIRQNRLLSMDQKYIVALSGGADSVSLLLILHTLGYHVEAAHCNFHLRGSESDRDELFCEKLCSVQNIPFHRVHFDTHAYAALHHVSIEMAARKLRYQYFEQLRQDINADGICVAHHQDDSVETILLNLIRGTGINGLTGIAPANGFVIRPLLCVNRIEIMDYLHSVQQDYVTDSTNMMDDFQRNKIRLRVLPLLEEINPAVRNNILKTGSYLRDIVDILDEKTRQDVQACVIRKDEKVLVLSADAVRSEYLLWQLLKDDGFSPAQVEQIYAGLHTSAGKTWYSESHQLLIDRGQLIVEPREKPSFAEMKVPEPGNYVIAPDCTLHFRTETKKPGFIVDRNPRVACLDADLVRFPLLVRPVKTGDRFTPYGMRGSKLVSNFLTDIKMNLFEKRRQLVVEDACGRIIWLVNERIDDRFRVTENTRRLLFISGGCAEVSSGASK